MSLTHNPLINTNGLKLFVDEKLNPRGPNLTFSGINYGDTPYTGGFSTSPTNVEWNRNITEITISVVIYKYSTSTGYATHPINMWGNGPSSLSTSGIILYNFGNYQNNGADGNIGWYMGDYDGTDGGWRGHGVAYGSQQIQVGEYYHVVFQLGNGIGNAWRNRNKLGNVSYPRPIAPSNVAGYGQNNFNLYGPYNQSFGVVKAGLWYNRRCSDDEIRSHYDYFARRYPLQTR